MGCFQTGLTGRSADVTQALVTRSLRFDEGTPTLTRTPSSSGSQRKFTLSMWIKRTRLDASGYETIWSSEASGINYCILTFYEDCLRFQSHVSGSTYTLMSNAKYRDVAAFYHITLSVDTDQELEANRIKIYVNGEEITFSSSSYPTRYYDLQVNTSSYPVTFGYSNGTSAYFAGYVADIHFIDGEAKSPTDFIELGDYGNYIPKEYTGSFGRNGFHVDNQPKNSADLLIQSDHNEASPVFSDSANGIAVTAYGNARHSIYRASPFASDERSFYFDGINDYIKVGSGSSDFAFGTGDYTIEGWFNFASLSGVRTICDLRPFNSIDNNRTFFGTDGSGLYMYLGGSNTTLAASGSLTENRWLHIAFVRSSGTLKTYIDGELKTSITSSTNHSTDGTPHLGSTARFDTFYNVNHEAFVKSFVYDFRIIKGTAAYTGEFTPPNGKLSSTGGSYPSTTNVNTSITSGHTKLLIQPEKGGSIDDETSNHTITVTGAVMPSSGPYEPATKSSSIFFDGSGDYLQTTTSSDLTFGTGSFTAEVWFMPYGVNTSGNYRGILSDEVYGGTGGWGLLQRDDELSVWIKNTSGSWVSFVADGALTAYQWQHIAVSYDSSTTTTRLFVDGTVVDSGTTSGWNLTGDQVEVGRGTTASTAYINGMVYDVRVTKGSALYTAAFDSPTAPFEVEPVFIGADHSGNRLHLTSTGISSHDVMLDTPTKNYATINPLNGEDSSHAEYDEGNLHITYNNSGQAATFGATIAFPKTGKWYAEVYIKSYGSSDTTRPKIGICRSDYDLTKYNNDTGQLGSADCFHYQKGGNKGGNSAGSSSYGASHTTDDIIGVAFDSDNGTLTFYKNGTSQGQAFSGLTKEYILATSGYDTSSSSTDDSVILNFGQDPTFAGNKTSGQDTSQSEFYYAPPSGFKSLNTSNLAAPTLIPTNNFDVLTYNGAYDSASYSGTASQTITGTDFTPAIVWIKDRDNLSADYNNAYSGNYWFDSVLGTGSAINVDSDNSSHYGNSLASGEDGISSFNSNGFTVDEAEETNYKADTDYDYEPDTAERYVAWCWKLGSTGSTSTWASGNTNPDTEKYNALAGVSIVNYYDTEYTSSSITLNHSLGAAPEFAIAFDHDGNFSEHYAWHKDLSSGNYLTLDSSSGQTSDSSYWPASPATATTITLGNSICSGVQSHVALFTPVENFSKFGSYTGNGNADGPFIYTGFRPAFVMIKNIDNSSVHWNIHDSARDTHNLTENRLSPNNSNDEDTGWDEFDFLSNGFKARAADTGNNGNGNTIIYAAFAESPFKHANAR